MDILPLMGTASNCSFLSPITMHPLLLELPWFDCELVDLSPDESHPHDLDMQLLCMNDYDISCASLPITTTTEDSYSSCAPSSAQYSTYWDGNSLSFNFGSGDYPLMEITQSIILDKEWSGKEMIGDMSKWMEEISGGSFALQRSPSPSSSSTSSLSSEALDLPGEETQVDNQRSILHLLKACGEAKEKTLKELEQVITGRVRDKAIPVGSTLERLGYYFSLDESETDYLKQESNKNYEVGLMGFYETCPYGRFAHFTANRAILEALPSDAETVHIVDFDMGEGVQWPPMFESLMGRAVRITAVKWKEQAKRLSCRFQETRRRLCEYAQSLGLALKVEEIEMEELPSLFIENKRKRKRCGENAREWVAANCMVGLPHMGSVRSARLVAEFMRVIAAGKESVGILTFGSGEVLVDNRGGGCDFGSYFEGSLLHFHALLESMEQHLPSSQLLLARTAMETLFVAPNVSSEAWFLQWKEGTGERFSGFEGRGLSMGNVGEARDLVFAEGESNYGVKVKGHNGNELVLEWKETALVRMSAWKK